MLTGNVDFTQETKQEDVPRVRLMIKIQDPALNTSDVRQEITLTPRRRTAHQRQ